MSPCVAALHILNPALCIHIVIIYNFNTNIIYRRLQPLPLTSSSPPNHDIPIMADPVPASFYAPDLIKNGDDWSVIYNPKLPPEN